MTGRRGSKEEIKTGVYILQNNPSGKKIYVWGEEDRDLLGKRIYRTGRDGDKMERRGRELKQKEGRGILWGGGNGGLLKRISSGGGKWECVYNGGGKGN